MNGNKLLLCYISGLDLRRVNEKTTPFIYSSIKSFPFVSVANHPGNDLLPTVLTGTYPNDHGMWGVKIKQSYYHSIDTGLLDILPDFFTTTGQCLAHFFTNSFDLAAIPPKRRRHFEIKRTKYLRRSKLTEALLDIGTFPTCLEVVGKDKSRFMFDNNSSLDEKLMNKIGNGNYELEILELYTLDLIQQWNLDSLEKVKLYYSMFDKFLMDLNSKCNNNKVTLCIFSDHGHEQIKSTINLIKLLQKSAIDENEYTFFMDVSIARFWFRTEMARQVITEILQGIDNSHVFSNKDLAEYNLVFDGSEYGEVFSILDPGYIFFPNDFYQPLANLYFGITDERQRSRLVRPHHRGTHGYLPDAECENSFMLVFDTDLKNTRERIEIIDIAPSLLSILGYEIPDTMRGVPAYIF